MSRTGQDGQNQAENYLSIRATNQSQIIKKMYQFRKIKHLLDGALLDIDFDFLCTCQTQSHSIKPQPKYAKQIESHTHNV